MRKGHELDEWMPVFITKWLTSPVVRSMRDYQRGWYWDLLCRAWKNSERPCHLRHDFDRLWMEAGADSEKFFKQHCAIVIGCFSRVVIDGVDWLVQNDQLEIYNEQLTRYRKRSEKASHAAYSKHATSKLRACSTQQTTVSISNLSSDSKFSLKKEKKELGSEELVAKVIAIGFRDSTLRSNSLIERALFEEREQGADLDELYMKLCQIHEWTANGEFAPKCYEVIPRWREPQNLWERKANGKSNSELPKSRAQLAIEENRRLESIEAGDGADERTHGAVEY